MTDALSTYQNAWDRKPVLRAIYDDFYDRIAGACGPGPTLEIGGGIGNLKRRLPDVIASDIQFGAWLDLVADAQRLPFGNGSLGNIVMVDVLHHIEHPLSFLRECGRALRPGGRVVVVEPAITPVSRPFYHFIHPEPVRMDADPLSDGAPSPGRDPYDSNQAIPTLIATSHRDRLEALAPFLHVTRVDWFSLAAYPLSGGFKPWSLVGEGFARKLLKWEAALSPHVGKYCGFRMLAVIERRAA